MPHPVVPGEWCPRYQYIGKSQDDAVIHLGRLSKMLRRVPIVQGVVNWIGRMEGTRMSELSYFVSWEMVEWIAKHSEVANGGAAQKGETAITDLIKQADVKTKKVGITLSEFHDHPEVEAVENQVHYGQDVTESTIIVHQCETRKQFSQCMIGVLGLSTE
ncbi:hypothetical protein HDU98_005144 [Podochytrium sp. JEL0797]|nr:hypothetical protein HDU98_005144 [Podochytrium sp. JEL0797]